MESQVIAGTLLGDYTVRITHSKQLDDATSFQLSDRIDEEWEALKEQLQERLQKLSPGIVVQVD